MTRSQTTRGQTTRGRFPVGLTITVAISLAILISLGMWQVQRLTWKTQLLANVAAAKTADVTPLPEVLKLKNPEYRRTQTDCSSLATAPFIELHAIIDGKPGVRLISPCYGPDGTILVDRGFVADTISARPSVGPSAEAVRITGILRKGDKGNSFTPPPANDLFYARDLDAMKKALHVEGGADYFLMAETSSNPEWQALKPAPLPTDIPNRHLEYALTWFALAGVLLAIYAAMLLKRLKA